ncbi:uncharacterized protein LOC124269559 [Haliotis rubra]|uniref:uncharacterized protein LOC124269559 n=1 Tax=Haliotis rubra TaxID=36100 RepID=UPI001EE514C1|nr:uncharacterized protein LOC124269559 [Haliotis rubra]
MSKNQTEDQGHSLEAQSDPKSYPEKIHTDPKCRTVAGLHLRVDANLVDRAFRLPLRLWRDVLCVVGLDDTAEANEWRGQEEVLRELAPNIPAGCPVVVWVRGPEGDELAGSSYTRVIRVLKECLPQDKPLVVPNSTREEGTDQEWLEGFPQSCFSFTSRVVEFPQGQMVWLRAVPEDRVLMGTDCPDTGPEGCTLNSSVAVLCGASGSKKEGLLLTTNVNARLFILGDAVGLIQW